MEVKKGYKQTEIGLIPTDWDLKRLGELGKFSKGQGIRKNEAQSGDIPCVRYGEIYTKYDSVIKEFYSFISPSVAKTAKKIKYGDILFAGSGETKEEIGKCIANTVSEEAYAGGDIVILSPLNADPLLLGYLLNTTLIAKQKSSKGQGDAVVHISAKGLKDVVIPLPKTKSEQLAIAAVLSETNSLITKLEKLIAKKEAIKKGIMHELLTGKKRLPGFSEKWRTKKLSEIGKPFGGLTGKSKKDFENGKQPYIPFMNVMSNAIIDIDYFDFVTIGSSETQNKVLKGDLLFNGSSETPEEVGMCSVLLNDVPNLYLNSFCFGFRLNKELHANALFLSYFFRSSVGRRLFYSSAQGATRYNLSKNNFLKIEIPFPKPEEQEAIADIIKDLKNEILHLKDKAEKFRVIKQGMMQNLLTGKIRLL